MPISSISLIQYINMSQRSFYLQLLSISVVTSILLFLFLQRPSLQSFADLSWLSLVFFIGLSIAMYYAGYRAAKSENKYNFTNTVMLFTMGKMMFSILIILGYFKIMEPESKLFILPFFGVYLVYTIFETYFMTRLGKMG